MNEALKCYIQSTIASLKRIPLTDVVNEVMVWYDSDQSWKVWEVDFCKDGHSLCELSWSNDEKFQEALDRVKPLFQDITAMYVGDTFTVTGDYYGRIAFNLSNHSLKCEHSQVVRTEDKTNQTESFIA